VRRRAPPPLRAQPDGGGRGGGDSSGRDGGSAATAAAPPAVQKSKGPLTVPPCANILSELASGAFWEECEALRAAAAPVPWGARELAAVLGSGVAALVALSAAAALTAPGAGDGFGAETTAAAAAGADPFAALFAREMACALGVPALLFACLREASPFQRSFFRLRWDGAWAGQAALLAAVAFPLADPLLSTAWAAAVQSAAGIPPDGGTAVLNLQAAAAARDGLALSQAAAGSVLLAPLWEEVFFRGFFLASLTKVLPTRVALPCSALAFAALHTSAPNFAPLLLLGGCCDALWLRSRNLAPPLLFHAAWNGGQLAAIVLLGKQTFV